MPPEIDSLTQEEKDLIAAYRWLTQNQRAMLFNGALVAASNHKTREIERRNNSTVLRLVPKG